MLAFEVACPKVKSNLRGQLRVASHQGKARGLVMFFTGGNGTRWWAGANRHTNKLVEELRHVGFVVVQVKWDDTWHHSSPGNDAGTAHLACRPATVIKFVHEKYYKPLQIKVSKPGVAGFCITGNSGGASQVSYALSHYGLDEILDVVIPTGGPPHAALAKSMLADSKKKNGYGYPERTRAYIDKSFGYFDKSGPGKRQDATFKKRWDEESVATGGNDYHHPKTRIHFLFGENDQRMQTVGKDYFDRLKEAGSPMVKWEIAAQTGHSIFRTTEGRAALKSAILGINRPKDAKKNGKVLKSSPGKQGNTKVPQRSDGTKTGKNAIDWGKAKRIYRKFRAGEKLTADDKTYLDRARAARKKGRRKRTNDARNQAPQSERSKKSDPVIGPKQIPDVVRFDENPIIHPRMLPKQDGKWKGANICGPSLIRVPDWVQKPLGKYYLYFAHHNGSYIRLAYADRLQGPWHIYEPGTLELADVLAVGDYKMLKAGHIASPDVHVDHNKKEIRMYFHGLIGPIARWGHNSGVALSKDGLNFKPLPKKIGDPYFRVFQWQGYYYAVTRTGNLARSKNGLTDWEESPDVYLYKGKAKLGRFAEATHDKQTGAVIRHTALRLDGNVLSVYFTRVFDAPEAILLSRVELHGSWTTWKLSPPVKVLEPKMAYEGGKLPVTKSRAGSRLGRGPIRALQDPCIYCEGDRTYLLYAVAGENGIAIAELKE